MLLKNMQELYYSLQIGESPIYELDEYGNRILEYVDEEGNAYYRETGSTEIVYSTPVRFLANISSYGNSPSDAVQYGLSINDYQAIIICDKGYVPITEGSLIWHTSPIINRYGGTEIEVTTNNGEKVMTTVPIDVSSDYMVIKVSPSLQYDKYILKSTNK